VVDDTIHLLHGFERARMRGLAPGAAMSDSLEQSGHALLFTALVLALGFATLALSEFRPTARFGQLCAVTITLALAAELLLLPALVHALAGLLERPAVATRRLHEPVARSLCSGLDDHLVAERRPRRHRVRGRHGARLAHA
jgi:multidrug efflux pump subunit AcrB